jgi:hypothetical protein
MADPNRALVGRILLLSAIFLGLLAAAIGLGLLPIDPRTRDLFTVGLAICAVSEALVALFLLMRS